MVDTSLSIASARTSGCVVHGECGEVVQGGRAVGVDLVPGLGLAPPLDEKAALELARDHDRLIGAQCLGAGSDRKRSDPGGHR